MLQRLRWRAGEQVGLGQTQPSKVAVGVSFDGLAVVLPRLGEVEETFVDVGPAEQGVEVVRPLCQVAVQAVQRLQQLITVQVMLAQHFQNSQAVGVVLLDELPQEGFRPAFTELEGSEQPLNHQGLRVVVLAFANLEVLLRLFVAASQRAARAARK